MARLRNLEKRIEAYLTNGDPTVPLKDKDGKIPKDLTTVSFGTSGPGHNFFFSSRRRHTICGRDWSSDVCSSDLVLPADQRRQHWTDETQNGPEVRNDLQQD